MNIDAVDYVLTVYSPGMLGESATTHCKSIPLAAAKSLITNQTKVLATKPFHEQMARKNFPFSGETIRNVNLLPGSTAVHVLYKGPPLGPDGEIPEGGFLRAYLLEVDEYQEANG